MMRRKEQEVQDNQEILDILRRCDTIRIAIYLFSLRTAGLKDSPAKEKSKRLRRGRYLFTSQVL